MISVWGKFYPTTNNYKEMDALHALYPTTAKDHTKDWLNREYSF
jgi:alpha-D-xyloside xylohydrolase